MSGDILAVVGGQYGSEGKGVIVNHLANRYQAHVRVGGPNAGHSLIHGGRVFKMQSLPCGWTNPYALLVLGRGGLINFPQLLKEILEVEAAGYEVRSRLRIDSMAGVLDERHHNSEGGVEGELHKQIGSTGEGVGAARIARIQRQPDGFSMAQDVVHTYGLQNCIIGNVSALLMSMRDSGKNILLEGTQGSGLSLVHGPWPFVTSADTNAAQMAADVGIPPRFINRTVLVIRSNPIRVAGNSGPLKGEMTWDEMSKRLGRTVIEQTTVTKKVRRVGEWDEELVRKAVQLNAPTSFALTFADYIDPACEGVDEVVKLTLPVTQFMRYLTETYGVPVAFVGTGGAVPNPGWQVCQTGVQP